MFSDFNTEKRTQDSFARTLSRDQRRQARQLMVEQFRDVLQRSRGGNIYWTGSKTDLIELTYEMFAYGDPTDAQGRPCSFVSMVAKVCSILHIVPPGNPYSLVRSARFRKGIKQQSFFSRYCFMLFRKHLRNPLHESLRRFDASTV